MDDLFQGDPVVRALLARIEALEAAVFAKAPKAAKEAVDEPLNAAWQKWNRHRGGKKGWTAEARTLSMRTLRKLAGADGNLALAIVDQSIENGWTGLFPPREAQVLLGLKPKANDQPTNYKPASEALKPTESKQAAQLGWLRQQHELGALTDEQYRAECRKVRG